jgi:hypothetical protein
MEKTMKALYEKTDKFEIFYAYAYNDGPSVGMRAVQDIITDGIVWLVAADAYANGVKLGSVSAINDADIESLTVEARASALVYGLYVTVELGKYSVEKKDVAQDVLNNRGYLTLVRK